MSPLAAIIGGLCSVLACAAIALALHTSWSAALYWRDLIRPERIAAVIFAALLWVMAGLLALFVWAML